MQSGGQETTLTIPYSPFNHQTKFHSSLAKIRLMLAGIRGGKTIAGTNEGIKAALVGIPGIVPPNRGCIVAPSYPMLRDVVLPEFFKFCPDALIKRFSHSEMMAELINGSVILFRTADMPDRLRGLDLNWFWMDEAAITKSDAYKILLGRISQKAGRGWITTTPKGYNYLYKDIFLPFCSGDRDYQVISYASYENPYYPKDEIERLRRTYAAEFFAQEIEAQFVQFSGLVYKDFSRRHIVQEDRTCKYYVAGVDWGFVNEAAILVCGVDSDDNIFVADEFYQSGNTTDELVIHARRFRQQYRIVRFYCDPSEPAAIEVFNRHSLNAVGAMNEVAAGISKVTEAFRTSKLFIHERCRNLIRELEFYSYPEKKEEKTAKEEPIKVNDHACLIAGTMVLTSKGEKPIETIKTSDMVLTRYGYRRVLRAGLTGRKREIFEIRTGQGNVLRATANHPIYAVERGFIPLDTIRYAYILKTPYNNPWKIPSSWTVSYSGSKRTDNSKTSPCAKARGSVQTGAGPCIGGEATCTIIRRLKRKQDVYNLVVEKDGEFYANGILVHNCDALRYAIATLDLGLKAGFHIA